MKASGCGANGSVLNSPLKIRRGRPVGDPHDAGDHLAFGAIHGSRAFSLGDDEANFFVADPVRLSSGLPQQGQHQLARPVEYPDQWNSC